MFFGHRSLPWSRFDTRAGFFSTSLPELFKPIRTLKSIVMLMLETDLLRQIENARVLITWAISSIQGIRRPYPGVTFYGESIFEVEKSQILFPEAKHKKIVCLRKLEHIFGVITRPIRGGGSLDPSRICSHPRGPSNPLKKRYLFAKFVFEKVLEMLGDVLVGRFLSRFGGHFFGDVWNISGTLWGWL